MCYYGISNLYVLGTVTASNPADIADFPSVIPGINVVTPSTFITGIIPRPQLRFQPPAMLAAKTALSPLALAQITPPSVPLLESLAMST